MCYYIFEVKNSADFSEVTRHAPHSSLVIFYAARLELRNRYNARKCGDPAGRDIVPRERDVARRYKMASMKRFKPEAKGAPLP